MTPRHDAAMLEYSEKLLEVAHQVILLRRHHALATKRLGDITVALFGHPRIAISEVRMHANRTYKLHAERAQKAQDAVHRERVKFHAILRDMKVRHNHLNLSLNSLKHHLDRVGFKHDPVFTGKEPVAADLQLPTWRTILTEAASKTTFYLKREAFVSPDGITIVFELLAARDNDEIHAMRLVEADDPKDVKRATKDNASAHVEARYVAWDIKWHDIDRHDIAGHGRFVVNNDVFDSILISARDMERVRGAAQYSKVARYMSTVRVAARAIPLLPREQVVRTGAVVVSVAPPEQRDLMHLEMEDYLVDCVARGRRLWIKRVIDRGDEYNALMPDEMTAADFARTQVQLRFRETSGVRIARIAKFI